MEKKREKEEEEGKTENNAKSLVCIECVWNCANKTSALSVLMIVLIEWRVSTKLDFLSWHKYIVAVASEFQTIPAALLLSYHIGIRSSLSLSFARSLAVCL